MTDPAQLAGSSKRVDIPHARFRPRGCAWIELLGTLLLLRPFCSAVLIFALPFTAKLGGAC